MKKDSSSESSSESEKKPDIKMKPATKKAAPKKAASSSSDSSDDSSDSESEKPAPKKVKAKAEPAKKPEKKVEKKESSDSDSDGSDSGSDAGSSSESEKPKKKADKKKPAKKDSSDSGSSSNSDDSDMKEEEEKAPAAKVEAEVAIDKNDPDFGKLELFVQGLSFDSNDYSVKAHFEPYGTMTKCKFFSQKGIAFIEYDDHANARKALNATNESELDGRQIFVGFSRDNKGAAPSAPAGNETTVFVGNLSFHTTKEALEHHFSECGASVKDVRIAMGEDGRPRGFAHVEFNSHDDAKSGLAMNQ